MIVVDMQNDFITGSLETKEAEAIVPRVVKKIEDYKVEKNEMFFTRDTHFEDYLSTQEGEKLPVPHCIKCSLGWELAQPIKEMVEEGNVVIDKLTFGSTYLAEQIKALSEKAIKTAASSFRHSL